MARKTLTPAEVVIAEFGIRPLARDLDVDPTTIVRWRRNDGGLIPSSYHKPLLALAVSGRKTLSTDDLINGRIVNER